MINILKRLLTILLYGSSGDGKTAQISELAEYLFLNGRSPKGRPWRSRIYAADEGGTDVCAPWIKAGIIEVVELYRRPKPWEWLNAIVQGKKLQGDVWVEGRDEDIALYAFESATSIGEQLRMSAPGSSINDGGKPLMAPGDKDAHGRSYGMAQDRMAVSIKQSFGLPGIKLWTARVRGGEEEATAVLGPQIVGKALTAEVPAWFNYTFRIVGLPADAVTQKAEVHRLYLADYLDAFNKRIVRDAEGKVTGVLNLKGMGNPRAPLGGGDLPAFVEPASIIKAFEIIENASRKAEETLAAKLKAAGLTPAVANTVAK